MRTFACAKIILDLRETLARRRLGEWIEDQRSAGAIIEQCVELFVKQRQPMFETLMAAAFADGFVERVAARLRAEMRDIGLAEPSHRFARQLHFAHRHEIERAELAGRALRFGIEGADQFERIAEKIEAQGLRHSGRKKIEDAATHGIFASVAHARCPREAIGFEPVYQRVPIDHIARRG